MRPPFVLVPAVLVVLACGDTETEVGPPASDPPRQERVSIGPPSLAPEVRGLLDEGNEAFEQGDHEGALRSFEAAIAADSSSAPAWFGVYMVRVETGNREGAAEARARLATLARPRFGDPHAGPATGDEGSTDSGPEDEEASGEGIVDETSQLEGGT